LLAEVKPVIKVACKFTVVNTSQPVCITNVNDMCSRSNSC
jgi:hypothetical protein